MKGKRCISRAREDRTKRDVSPVGAFTFDLHNSYISARPLDLRKKGGLLAVYVRQKRTNSLQLKIKLYEYCWQTKHTNGIHRDVSQSMSQKRKPKPKQLCKCGNGEFWTSFGIFSCRLLGPLLLKKETRSYVGQYRK